ncbi:hypothetical protein HHI36_016655 [Cryptolaemus montrouzieri]|uniref:Uncharacterized protein n=1 Tax=Cryptolaemus montrouzieri TaxID=559131 RepID=A0ABD2NKB4_9CUCU
MVPRMKTLRIMVFRLSDVFMKPPSNENGEVMDEDSGDEEQVRPSNLPDSQLSAPAEIHSDNRNRDDQFDLEDEISAAELTKKLKKSERKDEL